MFRAAEGLKGIDDFTIIENFQKWQLWYREQIETTVEVGAAVILEWYTFQFQGTDLIITANTALEGEAEWYDALHRRRQGAAELWASVMVDDCA